MSIFKYSFVVYVTVSIRCGYCAWLSCQHRSCQWLVIIALVHLAGCASTPEHSALEVPQPNATLTKLVSYALSLQGAPYRYGKASPTEGFDCSGFVWHVYQQQGIVLPRTAQAMAMQLPAVSKYAMHSGDLVFFNTTGRPFSHVGIYVEDNHFIHAPSQRTGEVIISTLKNTYWHQRFMGVRRP